jgi:hypothetical protein
MAKYFITPTSGAGMRDLDADDENSAKAEAQAKANDSGAEYALYERKPGEYNQLIGVFSPEKQKT